MSSLVIASIIFALLVLLVGYAYVHQALEKRRQRRQRLLTALKHRQRNFKFMISGLPEGFLPKELTLIVYRALLDACEHLSQLEPKDRNHLRDFNHYASELETLKHRPATKRHPVANPEQAVEIKRLLQELYRFVTLQTERGNLSAAQGQTCKDQIKRLVLLVSVDAYTSQARQAQAAGKPRLAIHYYNLGKKRIIQENGGQNYQPQLLQINDLIAKMEQQMAQLAPDQALDPSLPSVEEQKEWEEFEQDEDWKKKQIYD